ncbi:MAG: sugar transferase [Gallionella sp.]|jgi:lipopolysaccharide/colanic/teichoic acid biosynthesis glycosyltransferase|nr:sugar transferase [Gallionella sp.]
MIKKNNTNTNWGYLISKRMLDLIFGIPLLLIAAPIFLIAALIIRLDSPGNPFFVQKRIGLRGKPFWIIKLRGMYVDAKERFPELYDYSGHGGLNFHFHYEDDPRVTRIGRYTRRTSIDEMPNFINVVLGDMSLVGPRPEVPDVMGLYGRYAEEYLSVKPGITCLSKCSGRDSLTKEETIQMDLGYIQSRSFLLDVKILWWTFVGVVLRRDVH